MMNLRLPFPPKQNADPLEWAQWYETLYRRVRGNCTSSGDADATIPSTSTYHAVTALSEARTLTLPPTKLILDGDGVIVQDESGDAGTFNITIEADGTETISGVDDITADFGRVTLIKRGAGKWFGA